jgi:hypothetical protein
MPCEADQVLPLKGIHRPLAAFADLIDVEGPRPCRGTSVGGRFSASANPETAVKLRPDFNAIVDVSVARIETARRDLHLLEDDIGLSAARALAAIALRRFPTAATVHVSGGEQPMGTAVPAAILDAGGRVLWEPEEADDVWGNCVSSPKRPGSRKTDSSTTEGVSRVGSCRWNSPAEMPCGSVNGRPTFCLSLDPPIGIGVQRRVKPRMPI